MPLSATWLNGYANDSIRKMKGRFYASAKEFEAMCLGFGGGTGAGYEYHRRHSTG